MTTTAPSTPSRAHGLLRPGRVAPFALAAIALLAAARPARAQLPDPVERFVYSCTMIFTARTSVEADGRLAFEVLEPLRGLYEPGVVGELLPDGRFRLSAEASTAFPLDDGQLTIQCYSPSDAVSYNHFDRPSEVLRVEDDQVLLTTSVGLQRMPFADFRSRVYELDRARPLRAGPGEYEAASLTLDLSDCDAGDRPAVAAQLRERLEVAGAFLHTFNASSARLHVDAYWPVDPFLVVAQVIQPGRLTFHAVRDDRMADLIRTSPPALGVVMSATPGRTTITSTDRAALQAFVAAHPVAGLTWAIEAKPGLDGGPSFEAYLLDAPVSPGISDAHVEQDPVTLSPYVALGFDEAGAALFGDLTTRLVGSRLAIVVDGRLLSAPWIEEPILGGRARITFGVSAHDDTLAEAMGLAAALGTGELPCVPVVETLMRR